MYSRKKNEQEKGKLDEQSNYNVFSFALRHVVAKPPVHCSARKASEGVWGSQILQQAASLDHCFANQGFGFSWGLQKFQQEVSAMSCSLNEAHVACSDSEKCRQTVFAGCCAASEALWGQSIAEKFQEQWCLNHCLLNWASPNESDPGRLQLAVVSSSCCLSRKAPEALVGHQRLRQGVPNSTPPTPARILSCRSMTPHPKWQIVSRSQCQCHQTCR